MFHQTHSIIIGMSVFSAVGLIGFFATGSAWYGGGVAVVVAAGLPRLWLIHRYERATDRCSPLAWAKRYFWAACTAAAGWGAWSAAMLFSPPEAIGTLIACTLGATTLFSAVRHGTMRCVAVAQTVITLAPLSAALVASAMPAHILYGIFVVPFGVVVLSFNNLLHGQTLQLLRQDQEKTDLLHRLEIANQELEVVNRHLHTLVSTDALTGVANRRAFDLTSAREWLRAARDQVPISMLMLDIDHFKAYNDIYGHQSGDECLRRVATAAASVLHRPVDVLARYGGEEFAVVLPNTRLEGATRMARHILAAVGNQALPHEGSAHGHVTVSIGAACLTPDGVLGVDALVGHADAALYAAKRSGRNSVQVAASDHRLDAHRGQAAVMAGAAAT
jgi:diguanylate cyclase (GGDEF)-like protein